MMQHCIVLTSLVMVAIFLLEHSVHASHSSSSSSKSSVEDVASSLQYPSLSSYFITREQEHSRQKRGGNLISRPNRDRGEHQHDTHQLPATKGQFSYQTFENPPLPFTTVAGEAKGKNIQTNSKSAASFPDSVQWERIQQHQQPQNQRQQELRTAEELRRNQLQQRQQEQLRNAQAAQKLRDQLNAWR